MKIKKHEFKKKKNNIHINMLLKNKYIYIINQKKINKSTQSWDILF